jgi:hypothetical protein
MQSTLAFSRALASSKSKATAMRLFQSNSLMTNHRLEIAKPKWYILTLCAHILDSSRTRLPGQSRPGSFNLYIPFGRGRKLNMLRMECHPIESKMVWQGLRVCLLLQRLQSREYAAYTSSKRDGLGRTPPSTWVHLITDGI